MALPFKARASIETFIAFMEGEQLRDEAISLASTLSPEKAIEAVDHLKSLQDRYSPDTVQAILKRPNVPSRIYWRGVADRLRQVRHQLSLSELDAAQSYGVHLQTYRRYERGHTQRNTTRKLVDFAERHNLRLDWLVEGAGEMFRGGSRPEPVAASNVVPFPARGRAS